MQTFRFAKVTRYHVGTNKKSAFMEFILNNHYKIVYLYFSVFQLVITNCFSIFEVMFCFGTPLLKKILNESQLFGF